MKSHVLLLFIVSVVLLGACDGEQTPVEVVRSFMTAVEAFDVSTAENLVCEAQRARVQESLETFENEAELGEAFDIKFEGLSFQEQGNDGNTAIVHVSGKMTISLLGQQETQEVNEEHVVVKEGGRWLVCDP